MQLYLKDDDGEMYEIKQAKPLQQGDVIVFLNACMHQKDIMRIEKRLECKFGRKVVVLDAVYRDIVTLPPVKKAVPDSFQTEGPILF